MARYLIRATYTAEGARGVLKEGGSSRRSMIEQAVQKLGGTLEAFYFAFGDEDAYVLVDLPDHATASAISLHVSASGAVAATTIALITPEEIDAASKMKVDYHPPGA